MTFISVSRAHRSTECHGAPLPEPPDICVNFPGIPAIISAVRRVVADAMTGSPRADDVVLVACELATNAIRHSRSGLPGGEFTISVRVRPGWARLEVTDLGVGDWVGAPGGPVGHGCWDAALAGPDSESGRGLLVAASFSDACGYGDGCAWAEVTWPPM